MANFAKLDEHNVVTTVVVVNDADAPTEQAGIDWLNNLYGETANWREGYEDGRRYNFPSAGFTYDAQVDAFIPPKPYPSWLLNTNTYQWQAPVPYPNDPDHMYRWDETTQSWVLVDGL